MRFIFAILNSENLGYAKSNNIGVQFAKGQILGLLNNDLIFRSGGLEPTKQVLESSILNAGLVGNIQYRVADSEVDHVGIHFYSELGFNRAVRCEWLSQYYQESISEVQEFAM